MVSKSMKHKGRKVVYTYVRCMVEKYKNRVREARKYQFPRNVAVSIIIDTMHKQDTNTECFEKSSAL